MPVRTTSRRLQALTVIVALILALGATRSPASAAVDAGMELDFICRVNAARADAGRPPLRVASELTRVARRHSAVMADSSHLHHNPNLATDVTGWTRLAENVGRGPSVSSLHTALMNSEGHRRNILDDRVTEIGVGVEVRGSTVWVTQVFRRPTSTSTAPRPNCGGSEETTAPVTAASGPILVTGDWNGDGRETPGRFRDGRWELSNSLTGAIHVTFDYGRSGDLPVVGDWNGNGRDTVGIVRDGQWLLRNSLSGGTADVTFHYGRVTRGDVPIVGDWNGNGRDTAGIIRDGEWHLRNSLSGGPSDVSFVYGRLTRGDVPLVGDWNGNGRDTVGIIRDGEWHLRNTHTAGPAHLRADYGRVSRGDIPVTGDWTKHGSTRIGIVRGADWHLRFDLSGGQADHTFRF
jgi:hypothetical protein